MRRQGQGGTETVAGSRSMARIMERTPGVVSAVRGVRREEQIAELVASGLSNRQIADTAHISERTVETHVRNILLKLDFQARTQIASWATARRLGS